MSQDTGVTQAAKGVTSGLGNLVGGVVGTAGGVVGTAVSSTSILLCFTNEHRAVD
jgi:hypothetical protein